MTHSYAVYSINKNTCIHVVCDAKRQAILSKNTIVSITNGQDIFYLEALWQSRYKLMINGKPVESTKIDINQDSKPFEKI